MKRRKPTAVPPRDQATINAELDALYAELPTIDCLGQCWDSCTRIPMTAPEQQRINDVGVPVERANVHASPMVCPALTMLHQCSVHALRPMICRLYGLSEGLLCSFGCRPNERGLLSDAETYEFLARAHDIAGEHEDAERFRGAWRANPEKAARVMRELRKRQEDEILADRARRRRIEASGAPTIYVRGRGQFSKDAPPSGANSNRQG